MNARKEKKESFPHTPIKNKAEKEREKVKEGKIRLSLKNRNYIHSFFW